MTPLRGRRTSSRPSRHDAAIDAPWGRRPPLWCMALVAVVAVLLTILILLPAAWVAPLCARYTQGRVALADVSGSLWRGSAFLVLAPGGLPDPSLPTADAGPAGGGPALMAARLPYRVLWHAAFWPLFTGEVRLDVREDRPLSENVRIVAGLNGAIVNAGGISVPASLLSGLGAPFNTLDLQGDTRLEWTDWHLLRSGAYGQLTVILADMSSAISRVSPLGSYRAVIRAAGPDITVDLSTEKGPLFLSGKGQGNAGGFQFNGQAHAGESAQANLSGLLPLLGPRVDADTVVLRFP